MNPYETAGLNYYHQTYGNAPSAPSWTNQKVTVDPSQFKDPVSLHNAFKAGQINKQQFQTRLFQIQPPKAGNSHLSFGQTISQTAKGIPGLAVNMAKQQASDIGQAAHTAYTADISNPTRLAAAEISHNPVALANVVKNIQSTPIHKVIGAGLKLGSLVIPAGKGVEALSAEGGAKLGLKEAVQKATSVGAKQIPAGAAYGAGAGISAGQKPGQIVKSAATGAAVGVGLGAAGSLLGQAVSRAKAIREAVPTAPPSALDNHIVEAPKTATETSPPPKSIEGAQAPGTKTSGSALRTEQKAVESGLSGELAGKAAYSTVSHKTEAANAVQLLHDNPAQAMDIAMGKVPGNNSSHEAAVYHAVANDALAQAKKSGDYSTVTQLASSPRHTGVSEAAQKLGAEGFNTPAHDPIRIMNDVSATRQKALGSKGANVENEAASIGKQVKSAVPTTSRQDWHSFVESLAC